MARPNSVTTRFRYWICEHITARLEPRPDPGESWCRDCELNECRTLLLPADSAVAHMHMHRERAGRVNMVSRWPARVGKTGVM